MPTLVVPLLQLRTSLRSQMCPLTHHMGCPYQSARLCNKHHRQGWACILEAGRPKSRCGQGWFPLRPLSLAYVDSHLLSVFTRPSFRVCVCPNLSSQGYSQISAGTIQSTSVYCNYLFKGPITEYNHILRRWVLQLQHRNQGAEGNSAHNR